MLIHNMKNTRTEHMHPILHDTNIGSKAKGVYFSLLALHKEGKQKIDNVYGMCKEGRQAVASCIKELTQAGYFRSTQRKENGLVRGAIWEFPKEEQKKPRPESEAHQQGNIVMENENSTTQEIRLGVCTLTDEQRQKHWDQLERVRLRAEVARAQASMYACVLRKYRPDLFEDDKKIDGKWILKEAHPVIKHIENIFVAADRTWVGMQDWRLTIENECLEIKKELNTLPG
jgi:hypothetical protein